MSIRALNQLLGRSKIDPSVAAAYEQGHLDAILDDYDFSDEARRELNALEANTFDEFSAQALELILAMEGASVLPHFHDPRLGLGLKESAADEGRAA